MMLTNVLDKEGKLIAFVDMSQQPPGRAPKHGYILRLHTHQPLPETPEAFDRQVVSADRLVQMHEVLVTWVQWSHQDWRAPVWQLLAYKIPEERFSGPGVWDLRELIPKLGQ